MIFFFKKRRNKGMLILKIKCNKYNIYSNSNGFFFRKKVKKKKIKSVENFILE